MTPYLLQHLLSDAAHRAPENEAVRIGQRALTYAELDAAADGVARALVEGGIRRGDRVAILVPKQVEMLAGVYGVLRAGAAYVPLDWKQPMARLSMIASDCRVAAVITTATRAAALAERMPPGALRLILAVGDDIAPVPAPLMRYDEVVAGRSGDPGVRGIESDLAYILYTSGSTGVPKGVMLTHRHALTFVQWCGRRIGSQPDDRFSNHAPLHFDLSVFDLYVPTLGGAAVVLVPDADAQFGQELLRFIESEGITVWYSVPSALRALCRAAAGPEPLRTLRAVVFAGEVYPTRDLRDLRRLVPSASLWNLYGPTETNVCTYYHVRELPDDDRPIPIGRSCENTEVFALRTDGSLAGVGEEGELYVRGPLMMKGYWGRPDRTAEVLVQNPLTPVPDLVYRTGDLVRLRPDGDYDFVGRRDHQIKSRGYRIELGEIEAALHAHPEILEAVAVPVSHEQWGNAIVAIVVPTSNGALTEAAVKHHLAERLPRYMVPSRIILDRDLPRTSTGKVDRQRVMEQAELLTI